MRRCRLTRLVQGLLAVALLGIVAPATADDSALHTRIDQQFAADSGTLPIVVAGDAEFLRRVSLDLTGMPPTPAEVREFLTDQTPEKRSSAVDRLLASPQYPRRMAEFLDVTLMERRPNTVIPQDEWMAYLVQSMRANKPWNQLVRELLTAEGADDDPRAAARFLIDRGSEPNLITRDVGRIFFGRDMQCAQCHDHPLIDDYLQVDYHGLFAFFAAGSELKLKIGENERIFYAERAGSDAQFESVFVKGIRHLTGPRVLGEVELAEPFFVPGEEYNVPPADNTRPEPKFSRRDKLAELVASGGNRAFNENIANRIWAMLMGRGLVQPVDLHHFSNPPTHPALLQLLGEQIAAGGFDLRAFVRELALSSVYQRTYDVPPELLAQSDDIAALEQQRHELVQSSDAATMAFNAALDQWNATQAALLPVVAELDAARTKYSEILKRRDDARKAAADAEAQVAARQTVAATVAEAATKAQAAAAALAQDQELAAAAQKFVDRAAQIVAEVETLKAAAAEKTAAIAAPQAELEAARPGVEVAQQKTEPLRTADRVAEDSMNTARSAMRTAIAALNSQDERIQSAKLAAELTSARVAAAAAAEQVPVKTAEATSAASQAAEFVAVMEEEQSQMQTAAERLAAANVAVEQLTQTHLQQAQSATALATALAVVTNAQSQSPDDTALKQALDLLQSRTAEVGGAVQSLKTQLDTAVAARETATTAYAAEQAELAGAQFEKTRRDEAAAAATLAMQTAQAAAETTAATAESAADDLSARRTRDCQVAELEPLSPEELCWTVFRVTEVYDRYWQGQAAEVEKAQPLTDEIRNDPARMAARNYEIEQRTYDQLKSNVGAYASMFGNGAGQPQTDFFATADQALFVANGGSIMSWVAPAGGNITERIANETDSRKAAEDLYLSVLTRLPTEAEIADVAACFAAKPAERPVAAQELVWGLIASAEFRFNH
ncbi:MAG: DUF1549 domain-containing protein [Planctomycetaceae bacterium]|nr:DUF1549 domain-containing protein [Planctomycetaceae bacterium]